MASIRRQGSRYEIRECRSTPDGPRQYTLARFDDVLTPDVLDEAAAQAQRPFDAAKLVARARERKIPVSTRRRHDAARELIAELRSGRTLEPSLVALLQQALAAHEARALPAHLADAADWVGRSEAARGKALRGLLRTASRVVQSRDARLPLPEERFPRFSSASA